MILLHATGSVILSIFGLTLATAAGSNFNPLTEDRAFRATFRIQAFVENEPDYVGESFEQYHPILASADIWLKSRIGSKKGKIERSRYLYQGSSKKLVEIANLKFEDEPLESYLWEDGGSSSYKTEVQVDDTDMRETPRIVRQGTTLDARLFGHPKLRDFGLNLDSFLTKACRDKIDQNLHYVKGLARLLQLIECRREEFSRVPSSDGDAGATRGLPKISFEAVKLVNGCAPSDAVGQVTHLTMTVSVRKADLAHRSDGESKTLPPRMIPLSITLGYQNVYIIINLFNFEVIDLNEHLSESSSCESTFLMPLVAGTINLLAQDSSSEQRRLPDQFTFRAQLTGSKLYFSDPIEFLVAYDKERKFLARRIEITDRSQVVGNAYNTRTMQLVMDGLSRLKYHLMPTNSDHVMSDLPDSTSGKWTTCVANSMRSIELESLESSGGSLFDTNDATYMGMAMVRGVACHVYEKRIFSLPAWMGLGSLEHIQDDQLVGSEIYANIYEAAHKIANSNFASEQQRRRQDDDKVGKLMRLVISYVVPPNRKGGRYDESLIRGERDFGTIGAKFNFELLEFNWKLESLEDSPDSLDEISNECLISRTSSRYIELDTILEPDFQVRDQVQLSYLIGDDKSKLDELVSRLMTDNLGLALSQQVGLETNLNEQNHLEIKLKAYELPRERFSVKFINFARDLSVGNVELGSWSIGVTSVSLEECVWRATHTINLEAIKSDYQKTEDNQPHALIMFCPITKHCVVGDNERWAPMLRKEPVNIDTVISFPYTETDEFSKKRKSLVFSIEAHQSDTNLRVVGTLDTGGRPLLEWLVSKRDYFLNLSLDLNVDGLNYPMRVRKFKMSAIQDSIESHGGLWRPVQGLGYVDDEKDRSTSISVKSMAQCSHYCAMDHRCKSYSVCHSDEKNNENQKSNLSCLLSKVNWTEPAKVRELRDFAEAPTIGIAATSSHKISVVLSPGSSDDDPVMDYTTGGYAGGSSEEDNKSQKVDVLLRKSNLCSLHSQTATIVDAFQYKETSLDSSLGQKFLIESKSIEECAQFCLSRAHVINSINHLKSDKLNDGRLQQQAQDSRFDEFMRLTGGNEDYKGQQSPREQLTSIKQAVCTRFKFNAELRVCLPLPSMSPADELSYAKARRTNRKPIEAIDKYLGAYETMQARSPKELPHFIEFDSYELDEEKLYDSHRDLRLVQASVQLDANSKVKVQSTLADTTPAGCASQCLRLHNCRSFDVLQANAEMTQSQPQAPSGQLNVSSRLEQAANGRFYSTCVLNGESMFTWKERDYEGNDIDSLATERKLKIERVYGSSYDDNNKNSASAATGGDDSPFTWRHYEPTELALFVSGAIDYDRFWQHIQAQSPAGGGGVINENDNEIIGQRKSIFLKVRSIARELNRGAANGNDSTDNKNDSSNSTSGKVHGSESHKLMLISIVALPTMMIILLLVVARTRGFPLPQPIEASFATVNDNLWQPLVVWCSRSLPNLIATLVATMSTLTNQIKIPTWISRNQRQESRNVSSPASSSMPSSPFGVPYDRHL